MQEETIKNNPAENQEVPQTENQINKTEEYLNNWKRAVADLANYKKEEMQRTALLMQYSKENLLENLLPTLDSFYYATKSLPEDMKKSEWAKGFLQIESQVKDFLKKEGVEVIEVLGKKFDAEVMDIVSEEEGGGESGTVLEELQKGYKVAGKVLRAARVKVVK
jgi:molecular chaperone GrpE